MKAYEASLLRNKFDHLAFSPKVLSDKDRTDNIKMFLINSEKEQLNANAKVGDYYPKFKRPYWELSKSERLEFQRLSLLVKFQDRIPDFVKRELSRENVSTL